ncbi:MAG: barstar family protein [Lachnospiraceae bacterium]|nr:barstar family protein [Lachnospiraceae bacterium]MDY5497912.1 barstar family protein [Anaerobutyricum sp.]
MMTVLIDGNKIKTKEDFYKKIRQDLSLPEYFGNNLDALFDVLTERNDSIVFEFFSFNLLEDNLGRSFLSGLLRLLEDIKASAIIH